MYNFRRVFKSSLFKSSFVYTITKVINSVIPFLLMPILTRYLNPEDYGLVSMFGVLLSFIAPFTGLSIPGAITRQYYDRDEVDMPTYITNCLFILIGSTTVVSILYYFLATPISKVTSFPEQWMWAVIAVSASQFISQVNLNLWRVQVKPIQFGIYQISNTVFNLGISIWFVVGLGLAWKGRILAQIIVSISFVLVGVILLARGGWIKLKVNKSYMKNALKYGVPLLPHELSGTIKTVVDRVMITNMFSLSATGLYSVGYQIGNITGFLANSFNQAYGPWLYERLKRDKYEEKVLIVKFTYVYFIVIFFIALSLGLFSPWLFSRFLGPKFTGANTYILWISLGFSFNGMYMMVVNYIFYVRKTYILAWVTFSTAFVSIIFNYFNIKHWGPIGAAYTFAGMSLVTFLLVWILSSRVCPMPWNLLKIRR